MTKTLYSIYDSTADTWGQPSIMENDAVATRSFAILVNANDGNLVSLKPSDFSIWKVATFNDVNGSVLALKPEKIVNGDSVKEA